MVGNVKQVKQNKKQEVLFEATDCDQRYEPQEHTWMYDHLHIAGWNNINPMALEA